MKDYKNLKRRGTSSGRDPGGFTALPWAVLDCPKYRKLSPNAVCLLIELARQFTGSNNGSLILTRKYLGTRGWTSSDTIAKCKRQLLDLGFIFETFLGRRPNKASWYAVTWQALDKSDKYDFEAEKLFKRGAYRDPFETQNARLSPPSGTRESSTAPKPGPRPIVIAPSKGAVVLQMRSSSIPPSGHHIEIPSDTGVQRRRVRLRADVQRRRVKLREDVRALIVN